MENPPLEKVEPKFQPLEKVEPKFQPLENPPLEKVEPKQGVKRRSQVFREVVVRFLAGFDNL